MYSSKYCKILLYRNIFLYAKTTLRPIAHTKFKKSSRQTKIEWNCDGAEMRSISETEADEPSRGSRIFQQKNICDRADDETCLVVAEFIELPQLVERVNYFGEMWQAERIILLHLIFKESSRKRATINSPNFRDCGDGGN